MIALRLPADIERRLEVLAKKTGQTKSHHARQAIVRYLEDLEDASIARERLKKPSKRWTLAELEQGRDLER